MQSKSLHAVLVAALASALVACDTAVQSADAKAATAGGAMTANSSAVSARAWDVVQRRRVYFAHQSVGYNVLEGVRELAADQAVGGVKIVESRNPGAVQGPAIVHFAVGKNTDPASKNRDFLAFLDSRAVPDSAVVVLKYCYVDMMPVTDVPKLFADYQATIAEAKRRHPDLAFVHATMPLTTVEPGYKAIVKRLLGREVRRDLDVKRNAYNTLVRRAYSGKEPIFDLADAESRLPDGTRTFFVAGSDTVFALAERYSSDGGHLNDIGKRHVAAAMLNAIGSVEK